MGGGVQPESKSFGVGFCEPSFGHYGGKGGRVDPILKVLGWFRASFEVVYSCMFFFF